MAKRKVEFVVLVGGEFSRRGPVDALHACLDATHFYYGAFICRLVPVTVAEVERQAARERRARRGKR